MDSEFAQLGPSSGSGLLLDRWARSSPCSFCSLATCSSLGKPGLTYVMFMVRHGRPSITTRHTSPDDFFSGSGRSRRARARGAAANVLVYVTAMTALFAYLPIGAFFYRGARLWVSRRSPPSTQPRCSWLRWSQSIPRCCESSAPRESNARCLRAVCVQLCRVRRLLSGVARPLAALLAQMALPRTTWPS